MKVRLAEKILTMFGIKGGKPDQYGSTHKSEEYQLIYKAAEMILNSASDGDIIRLCQKRDLMDTPKCKKCGEKMHAIFSSNGVLDSWDCPNMNGITEVHR